MRETASSPDPTLTARREARWDHIRRRLQKIADTSPVLTSQQFREGAAILLRAAERQAEIEHAVDHWPPLTTDQHDRLAPQLQGGDRP
jgi:hypothetical protein